MAKAGRRAALGIRPTGWTFRRGGESVQRSRDGKVVVHGIPYSEHSSWTELVDCVRTLCPRKVVPTVNAGTERASRAVAERFAALLAGESPSLGTCSCATSGFAWPICRGTGQPSLACAVNISSIRTYRCTDTRACLSGLNPCRPGPCTNGTQHD